MNEQHWVFIHPFQFRLQRGIEVYLWNLATALAQEQIRVDIFTWDGPYSIPDYAKVPGLRVFTVPSFRYFQAQAAVFYYSFWLLKVNYQHVFINFAGYGEGMAIRLVQLFHRVPLSIVFHFPLSQVPHRYREFEDWNLQDYAQNLIGVSKATSEEVEAWSGHPCLVIGHGVDTKRFHPDTVLRSRIRKKFKVNDATPILVSASALEERKGIQWVIRALPGLLKNFPDLNYWILGDGPYRKNLEMEILKYNLQNNVKLLGFQSDIEPYLAASDIALLLSIGEASPISLLEFASAGLPIITSRHPPFPELVQDDWAKMVDERDSSELIRTILEILNDSAEQNKIGSAGRHRMIEYYTWNSVARQYKQVIERIG